MELVVDEAESGSNDAELTAQTSVQRWVGSPTPHPTSGALPTRTCPAALLLCVYGTALSRVLKGRAQAAVPRKRSHRPRAPSTSNPQARRPSKDVFGPLKRTVYRMARSPAFPSRPRPPLFRQLLWRVTVTAINPCSHSSHLCALPLSSLLLRATRTSFWSSSSRRPRTTRTRSPAAARGERLSNEQIFRCRWIAPARRRIVSSLLALRSQPACARAHKSRIPFSRFTSRKELHPPCETRTPQQLRAKPAEASFPLCVAAA